MERFYSLLDLWSYETVLNHWRAGRKGLRKRATGLGEGQEKSVLTYTVSGADS